MLADDYFQKICEALDLSIASRIDARRAGALAFVVDNASTRFDLALDESCEGTMVGQ